MDEPMPTPATSNPATSNPDAPTAAASTPSTGADETRMVPDPATHSGPNTPGHTPAEPYTVHPDASTVGTGGGSRRDDPPVRRRGGPDPVALVAGLVALVITALALTGTLGGVDPRWVLAAGALLVGGAVLLTTLRRRA